MLNNHGPPVLEFKDLLLTNQKNNGTSIIHFSHVSFFPAFPTIAILLPPKSPAHHWEPVVNILDV